MARDGRHLLHRASLRWPYQWLMSSAELCRTPDTSPASPESRGLAVPVWQVCWNALVGLTVDVRPVSGLGAVPTEIAERKTDRSAQDGRQDLLCAAV